MMVNRCLRVLAMTGVGMCCLLGRAHALELSLADAEKVAIEQDPLIVKYQAQASAHMADAVAEGQLPDPRMKFGLVNVPLDSFDLAQEGMTQVVVGVQQMFPAGDILDQKQERKLLLAEVERARAMDRALQVLRNLRRQWLEVYYQQQGLSLVRQSEQVFAQLAKITQFQYRAGRGTQQDLVRAQLELSLLQDKAQSFEQARQTAIAELEKWTGASIRKHTLSSVFPTLPELPEFQMLEESIEVHPSVALNKAMLAAARKGVAIEKARFSPGWMLDVSYGKRSGSNPDKSARADFLSAMVSLDLPFFTEKRQDKRLEARGQEVNAARDGVDAQRRELRRLLDGAYANWQQLGQRLAFYTEKVLPQATQFAETSRKAYQSRVSDFSELVRGRLRELDSNLAALRLRVERAKAHYDLRYLAGEGG